jgi:hypothetical protein
MECRSSREIPWPERSIRGDQAMSRFSFETYLGERDEGFFIARANNLGVRPF